MKNLLGLFHTELLEYLQHESTLKIKEEGFEVENDPELFRFRKELREALSGQVEKIRLEEIVENYRRLFEERGPLHLEKKLFQILSLKEFEHVGLKEYFPKIYRALPRLYRREKIQQSRIKKNFTHLPSLIRMMIDSSLCHLYDEVDPIKNAKIVLFTWVLPDGWGDLQASVKTINLLKEAFPFAEIFSAALVSKKQPKLKKSSFTHEVFYEEECTLDLLGDELLKQLKEADLILQIPTFYPFTESLLEKIGHRRILNIGEYGFVESSFYHPKTENRAMGLHFLEMGIFTKEEPVFPLTDLKSKVVKEFLFPKDSLKRSDIETYFKKTQLFLAYLTTLHGGLIYLHALFQSLEEDKKAIDIITPDFSWFVKILDHREGKSLLQKNFGIRSIDFHFGKEVKSLKLGTKGKKVRVLSSGAISPEDFRTLLHYSGDFVAVRGNQSFSEAIVQNKIFFYDGRDHAKFFMKDLLALAENRLKEYPGAQDCLRAMGKAFLYTLPEQEGSWVDETFFQEKEPVFEIANQLGNALKNKEVLLGFLKLSKILKEEYSFEEKITSKIQRELFLQKNPGFKEFEKKLVDLFLANGCSFTYLIEELKEKLAQGL